MNFQKLYLATLGNAGALTETNPVGILPHVRRLHAVFDKLPQTPLFKVGSCFVITAEFHEVILRERLSGCICAPMSYSQSATPDDIRSDGAYLELRVTRQLVQSDFYQAGDILWGSLKALQVL